MDSAMKDQFRSVHARFGGAASLHHAPLQLRHGLVPAHLPLHCLRFEGGFAVERDYASRHTQTLTLRMLISTLPAVRDEGAGEGVDEGLDGLPESAERTEDEDSEIVRCGAVHGKDA